MSESSPSKTTWATKWAKYRFCEMIVLVACLVSVTKYLSKAIYGGKCLFGPTVWLYHDGDIIVAGAWSNYIHNQEAENDEYSDFLLFILV